MCRAIGITPYAHDAPARETLARILHPARDTGHMQLPYTPYILHWSDR
jgi:hypothetical protein